MRTHFLLALKRSKMNDCDLVAYYNATIRSILEYGAVVFHPGLTKQQNDDIEYVQKRVLSIIYPQLSYEDALSKCSLDTLTDRREAACRELFNSMQQPNHRLYKLLPERHLSAYGLRNQRKYSVSNINTHRQCNDVITYCLNKFNCA